MLLKFFVRTVGTLSTGARPWASCVTTECNDQEMPLGSSTFALHYPLSPHIAISFPALPYLIFLRLYKNNKRKGTKKKEKERNVPCVQGRQWAGSTPVTSFPSPNLNLSFPPFFLFKDKRKSFPYKKGKENTGGKKIVTLKRILKDSSQLPIGF